MSTKTTYTFPASSVNTDVVLLGTAPFTVVLQPSAVNFGNEVVGTINYTVSGVNVPEVGANTLYVNKYSRSYTYTPLNALDISDSRNSFEYTFYNSITGATISYIGVEMVMIPSFTKYVYHFTINTNSPFLTHNPYQLTPAGYAFDNVHLIKSRAWGTLNEQIVVAEGLGTENQILLFNITDIASGANIKPDTPNPSPTPTMSPSISITPTLTPSISITPTPTATVTA